MFDLDDEYCHGGIDRREFLTRSAALVAGGLAMAQALLPRYAQAQTIFHRFPHQAEIRDLPSPGGNSGTMRGYLVADGTRAVPGGAGVHENRGLNPYIEDVARRAAVEGFLAFAPDGSFRSAATPATTTTGAGSRPASTRGSCAPTS